MEFSMRTTWVSLVVCLACQPLESGTDLDSASDTSVDGVDTDRVDSDLHDPDTDDSQADTDDFPDVWPWSDEVTCREGDPRCATPYDPNAGLSSLELQRALDAGREVWRTEARRGACAGCHAPDGLDLAIVGYPDADLRRRALDHVAAPEAEALVAYIHALRQEHRLTRLLHPDRFRPLQPAHVPLPQDDLGLDPHSGAARGQRDAAFMHVLTHDLKLLWASGTIRTLDDAQRARAELLAVDLVNLPIALPFDRLSEDPARGEAHMSVFEWTPGLASRPRPGREDAWYTAVDAYLADPSASNLWRLDDAAVAETECHPDLGDGATLSEYPLACDWMRLKWRSVLVFQHMLRVRTLDLPDPLGGKNPRDMLDVAVARSVVWEAGDHLRISPLQRPAETACFVEARHPCTLLPPEVDASIHDSPSYTRARIDQSQIFQQSWFVMGWLHDPALLWQGSSFATYIGDYLESVLLPDYDITHAFVVARMAASKSAAEAWFDAPGFREGTGKIASVRTFSFKQLRDNFSPPPAGDPRRATHDKMYANFARMWLLLIEEDLRASGTVYDREDTLRAARFLRSWIPRLEGAEDPSMNEVMRRIEALAPTATDLRSGANKAQYPGLQPDNRWGDFSTPYR
jgi:hypothetical protein